MKIHTSGYWPAFSPKNEIEEVGRVGPCFDIYCTEPIESNRRKYLCATMSMSNNYDLSNYLIVLHGLNPLDYISANKLEGFELWIEKAPMEATMYYFWLNYSGEGGKQEDDLLRNKYLFTRNKMACSWDNAMILQNNIDYIGSLSRDRLEYYANEFDMDVDKYVSRMKNNHRWLVKEYQESLEPGEIMRRARERQKILDDECDEALAELLAAYPDPVDKS